MQRNGYYGWVEDNEITRRDESLNVTEPGVTIPEPEVPNPIVLEPGKYPADIFERAKEMASDNWASNLLRKNKFSMNGAMIGLLGGFLLALFTHQSKLFFSIGGIVAGGIIGNMMYNSNNKVQTINK